MPAEHRWISQEPPILYIDLTGAKGSAEYLESNRKTCALLDTIERPAVVIIDFSRRRYFSGQYVQTANQMKLDHPNMRWMIFLGSQFALDLFLAYTHNFRQVSFQWAYAATFDEALELAHGFLAGKPPPPPAVSGPEWN
jgi:hypothetical protein